MFKSTDDREEESLKKGLGFIPNDDLDEDTIDEKSTIYSKFNVMPGKDVSETLHIKKYIVSKNKVIAIFDREYLSEMKRSPDHLIFTTALYHTQKLMYLAVAKNLGFEYDPNGEEKFKIWPYFLEINLPKLVTQKKDVVQTLYVNALKEIDKSRFDLDVQMNVGSSIIVKLKSLIKII